MLKGSYFYNGTIKKVVSVFGTLFNNIYTGKVVSGKMMNVNRVPLAYGPKEHFLMRVRTNESAEYPTDIAIKLPRMSFEMTSIAYDSSSKLNKINQRNFPIAGDTNRVFPVYQSVPYVIGMQLSIMSRSQDDALQIFEQIIPTFTPEYTVTVKDFEGPGTLTDMPIILNSTNFQDNYDGDFASTRRLLIYTLDFSIKVRFSGDINSNITRPVIKIVDANVYGDMNVGISEPIDKVNVKLGDLVNDTPEDYTVITTFGFDEPQPIPSNTLEGLDWIITSTLPSNTSINPQGNIIDVTTNLILSTPTTLSFEATYFNDPNDPFTGARGPNGERYVYHYWDNVNFGEFPLGYGSTTEGSYIRVYFDDILVLDSTDAINTLKNSYTVVVPLNSSATLKYRIEQRGDGYLNGPIKLTYD
jgi:hypothetical protein